MTFRIGVISDTHGLLRPEVPDLLAGVRHIVHAGDIGAPGIIEALRAIAPVTAIRGNIDVGDWARDYPETQTVCLAGQCLHVLHDLKQLSLAPAAQGIDVVISGHTHSARMFRTDGVLYLNPGSAGPRRFKLPISVAIVDLDAAPDLRPVIHTITVTS